MNTDKLDDLKGYVAWPYATWNFFTHDNGTVACMIWLGSGMQNNGIKTLRFRKSRNGLQKTVDFFCGLLDEKGKDYHIESSTCGDGSLSYKVWRD